jgi:hypothetical protein
LQPTHPRLDGAERCQAPALANTAKKERANEDTANEDTANEDTANALAANPGGSVMKFEDDPAMTDDRQPTAAGGPNSTNDRTATWLETMATRPRIWNAEAST